MIRIKFPWVELVMTALAVILLGTLMLFFGGCRCFQGEIDLREQVFRVGPNPNAPISKGD